MCIVLSFKNTGLKLFFILALKSDLEPVFLQALSVKKQNFFRHGPSKHFSPLQFAPKLTGMQETNFSIPPFNQPHLFKTHEKRTSMDIQSLKKQKLFHVFKG